MEYIFESFLFVTIISFLFYKWGTANFRTFTERNVKHEKPVFLVGNTLPLFMGKESIHKVLISYNNKFKSEKLYGFYNIRDPIFVIRDPELIKKVAIKDFDKFTNHRPGVTAKHDKILGNMLTMLQDQKWKDMRTTLTPVFTGSKMRQIFELIQECGSEAVTSLRNDVTEEGKEIDLKDFYSRYTVDVIASAAFGLKVNSYKDKNNKFYVLGRKILKFGGLAIVKFLIMSILPQLSKMLRIKVLNEKALNYLKGLVIEAISYRKENNIIRQDMIQLLLEAQGYDLSASGAEGKDCAQEHKRNWTDNEVIAQCLLFFFAGFETVSNMLCTTSYELVKNSEIQERLYEEIAEMDRELNGAPITYDTLKKMKYLDMVVSESLRKWPPAILTDRVCSKKYSLTDSDGQCVVKLKPGDNIWFSIIGSHYDEDNFPDPFTFNPERFNEQNKDRINPLTYIPFGVGPRNCIANRFGLMEGKAMLYKLLLDFKITACPRTKDDLMEEIKGFAIRPENLFWFKLTPRKPV